METEEYIGLDVGRKHTGIARASSIAKIASPLKTVPTGSLAAALQEIILKNKPGAVIIGLPRNLDGNDTLQTAWVRQWVKKVQADIKVPMFWTDEALTSQRSHGQHNEHAVAAAAILQDFLETPPSERKAIE